MNTIQIDMDFNVRDLIIGIISSGMIIVSKTINAITWTAFEDLIVAIIIALIGGFAAAAGRQIHKNAYEWRLKKREERERQDSDKQEPMA